MFFNRLLTKRVVKGVYFFNKKRWTVTFYVYNNVKLEPLTFKK